MEKKLLPIVLIVLLLLTLSVVKIINKSKEIDIIEELQAERLAPADFLASDIAKAVIYTGQHPEEKVVITSKDENWILSSAFNSPAEKEKITKFLENIKTLDGELRSSEKTSLLFSVDKKFENSLKKSKFPKELKAVFEDRGYHISNKVKVLEGKYIQDDKKRYIIEKSEDSLKIYADILFEYKITDKLGLHIVLYKKGKEEPYLHLVVGDKIKWSNCFIRRKDSSEVYTVNKELWGEVGIWGEDKKAKNPHWLKKDILTLEKDRIEKISLKYPDKDIELKKFEKKSDKPKKDEKKAEKPKKVYEWKIVKGGIEKELKKSGAKELIENMSDLDCTDVVNPDKKKEWGLDKPQFIAEVTLDDGKKKILLGAHKNLDGDAYFMLKSNDKIVYKVSKYTFSNIFKPAREIFKLPKLSIEREAVKNIYMKYPTGTLKIQREKKDKYKLLSPDLGFSVDTEKAKHMLEKLENLNMEDYADEKNPAVLGLVNPDYSVKIEVKDGSYHEILLGKLSKSLDGYYIKLDKEKILFAIKKDDYEKIFVPSEKLIKAEPFNLANIKTIKLKSQKEEFILDRFALTKWRIHLNNKKYKTNYVNTKRLLDRFKITKASRFDLNLDFIKNLKSTHELVLTTHKGNTTFKFYEKKNNLIPVTIEGQKQVYWISTDKADVILNKSGYYKREEIKKEDSKKDVKKEDSNTKKEEPKKVEVKKVEPKKDTKKEELKKVEVKKEEPKKVEPKKDSKKEEVKKEEPKKVAPKKDTKKEELKKVEVKKEEPKKVEVKKEEPKKGVKKEDVPGKEEANPKKEETGKDPKSAND